MTAWTTPKKDRANNHAEYIDMENGSSHEEGEVQSDSQMRRRRLLQTALAVAAGGALHSQAFAVSAASGESSAAHPGPMDSTMMRDAIKACMDCHAMCLQMAMNLCLERGGQHVEKQHLRLLLNCAELCQTSANFMLSNSPLHGRVCGVCAEACEACAKSCEQVGDMNECVEECQRCAKSCRSMA
jgi:hypothetical protein